MNVLKASFCENISAKYLVFSNICLHTHCLAYRIIINVTRAGSILIFFLIKHIPLSFSVQLTGKDKGGLCVFLLLFSFPIVKSVIHPLSAFEVLRQHGTYINN